MDISILQAVLIGLWTAFCFSGMLLGLYTNRCIVLSLGVGVILGDIQTATYTAFAGAPETAKKALQAGNFRGFKIAANGTIWAFAGLGFGLGVLGALSTQTLTDLFALIPPVLLNGLTLAGKMLPAIGFAMILSVMAKKELIPYILLGYVLAVYFGLPVLTPTANGDGVLTSVATNSVLGVPTIGVAIIATIFALLDIFRKPAAPTKETKTEGDNQDDWI
ncbi:TPA: PTS sugar transporter subunit IIC [Streptococcus agalactiae]